MALAIDDYILQATGGASVTDGLVSWLKTNGASNGAMADLHDQFLTAQGYSTGTLDDRWDALLVSLGYTGSLQDKLYAFWQAGGTIAGFTPASLFSAGEVGVWYDPSDFSTMFATVSSTTPVALDSQVGLILDKSRNLTFGSEKTTNGTFDTDSDWTKFNSGVTYADGQYTIRNTPVLAAGAYIAQQLSGLTTGALYRVTIVVTSSAVAANQASFKQGTAANDVTYGQVFIPSAFFTGTWSFNITAGATNPWVTIHVSGSNENIRVTSISIVEILGEHLRQTNSAKRPFLRRRYNRMLNSEVFNTGWTTSFASITANTEVAPNGTTTADTLTVLSNAYPSVYQQALGVINGVPYIASVYAKAGTNDQITLELRGPNLVPDARFDLTNGTVVSGSGTIVNAGNGWYRCSITATTNTINPLLIIGGEPTSAGTVYIWGAQLTTVDDHAVINQEYQSITTATSYNSDATKFPAYLQFDGADDSMVTGKNLDFSGTSQISVFAAVSKNVTSTFGIIAELSASAGTNDGSFAVWNNADTGGLGRNTYGTTLRGTVNFYDEAYRPYQAPSNAVTSYILQPSEVDQVVSRINGSSVVASSTLNSTSAGNFGSYLFYVGGRGGTTLFFNGRLYGLIVRGTTSTLGEIEDTESYLSTTSGVSL